LIDALGTEGSPESVDEILTFLDHDDSEVVAHAAALLGDTGIQRAANKIEELLAAEEDRRIAATLRKALARLQRERYP
jgi:HEAT repeat protein